jgi:Tfp pilus assembly protein PilV
MSDRRSAGFSLIETSIALALLAMIGLALAAMTMASAKLTRFTHEQDVALNAIRSYVESMRGVSLTAIYNDSTTPADYLPADPSFQSVTGEVFKITNEQGTQGIRLFGASGAAVTTTAVGNFTDGTALAFPRDLNGNGSTTEAPAPTSSLLVLPARVKLSWVSSDNTSQSMVMYVCFP